MNIGFKDDKIFLLSIEEYEKYRDNISKFLCWWWLRSPDDDQRAAAYVDYGGSVDSDGDSVRDEHGCVRPCLKINRNEIRIFHCGMTWIKLADNLYITEVPIATNKFDEESNDYETSEIRELLLHWYEERKEW